jgi:hypothetical protein
MIDVGWGEIQAAHADYLWIPSEAETQTAGAASDVQDAFCPGDAGEVGEQGRKTTAPSPHLELVAITVQRYECR